MGKSSENRCRHAVGLYGCGVLRGEETIGKSNLVYGEKTTIIKKGGMMEKGRIRKPREVELGIGIRFLEVLKLRDKFLEQSAETACSKMIVVPEISNGQ